MLAASLVGLIIGPLVHQIAPRQSGWAAGMDGFVLAAVGGLCVLHLLPHALMVGGLFAFLAACVGLILPRLAEHRLGSTGPSFDIVLALIALAIHAGLDGAALAVQHGHDFHAGHLGLAIALHRLPAGLLIFSLLKEHYGLKGGIAGIIFVGLATVVGFLLHNDISTLLSSSTIAIIEALVVGGLLHVIGHQHGHNDHKEENHAEVHGHGKTDNPELDRRVGAGGALLGAAVVFFVGHGTSQIRGVNEGLSIGEAFIGLSLECAPALLFAYTISAFGQPFATSVKEILSNRFALIPALSPTRFRLLLKGPSGLIYLRDVLKQGLPVSAAFAALLVASEISLDSLFVSVAFLGFGFTSIRFMAALFLIAIFTFMLMRKKQSLDSSILDAQPSTAERFMESRFRVGLRYGFFDLVEHTLPWVFIGVLLASLLEVFLAPGIFQTIPIAWQVPIFALLGIPFYIYASCATPLILIGIHKGVSWGAALAFLLVAPTIQWKTLLILRRERKRVLDWFVPALICIVSVLIGWTVDSLTVPTIDLFEYDVSVGGSFLQYACLSILAGLFLLSLLRCGPRGLLTKLTLHSTRYP